MDAIEKLDAQWVAALLSNDTTRLDQILADDLIYGHASGALDTKTKFLEKLRSGRQVYKTLDQTHVRVRILDTHTAVTHSWMRAAGTNANGPFDDQLMMLHVWAKQGADWQLVAHQTAKVEKLPE